MSAQPTLFDGDRCPACAGPLERSTTGRPATYCSATCRQRARRLSHPEPVTKLEVAPDGTRGVDTAPAPRNPPLAAIAAAIPTPADEYGPSRAYCEVREGGYGVVFGRDGGRRNELAGPVFRRPRQAIALAELLNERIAPAI